MSHITQLEYITALQNSGGLTQQEIFDKVQEWKLQHTPKPAVEKSEEVVEEEVVEEPVEETEEVVEDTDVDGEEYVFSQQTQQAFPSLFPKQENIFNASILNELKNQREIDQDPELQKIIAVAKPGETYVREDSSDKTEYKYEIEDGKGVYYYRNPGKDKWLTHKPGTEADMSIAIVFGHAEGDLDQLYRRRKQREQYNAYINSDEYKDFNDPTKVLRELKEKTYILKPEKDTKSKIEDWRTDAAILSSAKYNPEGSVFFDGYNGNVSPQEWQKKKNRQLLFQLGINEYDNKALDEDILDLIIEKDLDAVNNYAKFYDKKYKDIYGAGSASFDSSTGSLTGGSKNGELVEKTLSNYGFNFDLIEPQEGSSPMQILKPEIQIDNFSVDDFVGYMRKTGYGDEFVDDIYSDEDIYGVRRDYSSIASRNLGYADGDPGALQEIGKQRRLDQFLNSYLNDKTEDYNLQLQLNWIKQNPEAVKDVNGLPEAIDIAKKHFNKTYGTPVIPLFNPSQIQKWREEIFPELIESENLNAIEARENRQKREEENGIEGSLNTLGEAADEAGDTVWDRMEQMTWPMLDLFGFNTGAHKLVSKELKIRDRSREAQNIPVYVSGTVVKSGDYNYLRDSSGTIYNTDLGIVETALTPEQIDVINSDLDKNGEEGSNWSFRGGVTDFAGVTAGLGFDIAGMMGTGKFVKIATRFAPAKVALRMNPQTFGTFGYYTYQGNALGKNETYNQLIDAGVTRSEAEKLSTQAGYLTGITYGITSFMAPNTAYINTMNKRLGFNSVVNKSVLAYKNGGRPAFNKTWTDFMRNTGANLGNLAEKGLGEAVQENLQEITIRKGVNSFVNFRQGSEVLNTDYTFNDFMQTSILSAGAGSLMGGIDTNNFTSPSDKLSSLNWMNSNYDYSKNLINTSVANGFVDQKTADKLLFDVRAMNQLSKIPAKTDPNLAVDSAIILQKIADLETKLKNTAPEFSGDLQQQISDLKLELNDLVNKPLAEGSQAIVEQLDNVDMKAFDTTAEVAGALETIKQEGGEVDVKNSTNYGTIVKLTDEDGNVTQQIIINREAAAENNVATTEQHEVLHAVTDALFTSNPAAAINLGKSLESVLNSSDITLAPRFKNRQDQYKKAFEDGEISEAVYYEEILNLTSEGLTNGTVEETPSLLTKLKDFASKLKDFFSKGKDPINITFNTGKDVLDFIKGYNESVKNRTGLTDAQLEVAKGNVEGDLIDTDQEADLEVLDEVVITAKASKNVGKGINDLATGVTKAEWDGGKADEVIGDLFENNTLKGLIESKIPPVDQQPPGFNADDFVSGVFTELIPHIRNFNPEVNDSLSGWINSQLGNKIGNVFKSGDAGTKAEFDVDITEGAGVAAETEPIELDEVVVTAKKKSPKADAIYGSVMTENIGSDVATAIDDAIQTDLKTSNITDFGATRNIGPALGKILGKGFGINPQVFTDKSRNIQKKDLAGLTNLRQYLTNNAQSDFSNLPDAYNMAGKSTFIPNSILEALYIKDGKGKWKLDPSKTVLDYKALIGEINTEKPIYRSKDATIARALGILSFRNKMFETAFPTADLRVGTGVKFSLKTPAKSDKGVQADGRAVIEEVVGVPAINQDIEGTSTVKRDVVTSIGPAFGPLAPLFINPSNFAAAGNSIASALKRGFLFVNNPSKTKRKDKAETNQGIKDGVIGSVDGLVSELESQGIKLSDAMKDDVRALKAAIASQKGPKKVRQNQQNVNTIKAGKKLFYDAFKASIKADPSVLRTWQFLLQNQNANAGAGKNLATLNNDANGPYEEHWFPAGQYGLNLIKAAGISLSKGDGFKTLDNFIKFANKNYYQERIPLAVQNAVDKSYDVVMPDGETVKWNSKSQLHPLLDAALNKAIDTNTPEAWIEVDKLADIRKYPGKDVHTAVDPFVHGNNGKTDAEKYGIKVPVELQGNPNIKKAASVFIHDLIVGKVVGGKPLTSADVNARLKAYEPIAQDEVKSSKKNNNTFGDKVDPNSTIDEQIDNLGNYDKAAALGRALDTETKGISVFDFDDTLAKTKEKVIVNLPNGKTKEISASEFAKRASELEAAGATFDFSNFENVAKGTAKGPLADLALRRQDKFGSKDIFVLTARPQASATAIQSFLDGIGLNIPLENITGLADGTPGAKGRWVAGKAALGYNDFYFADDSFANVSAVSEILNQIDVKSKVQQAKFSKIETFDKIFNDILESSTGIESFKEYSKAKAVTVGKKKGRFTFFTTPSAEDFLGLLYKTLGKGKVGNAQLEFYKKNLLDPYDRAELSTTRAKIQAAADFKKLKGSLTSLPTSLSTEMGYGGFTHSQAARVAAWTRQGMTIPGLSKTDLKALNDFVDKNPEMNTLVDELMKIQKGKQYPAPGENWLAGSITTDVLNGITKVNRKEYLQEWQENVDIIFSDKNMNKLEAAYGPKYVEALRDQLRRMKSGSNRPIGGSRVVNNVLDWLNNSVGAIMFLNTRSAVLQTLSAVNFIGVGNNSLVNSAKAFANQKQYWKDFKTLMNSPYLVERRNGLKINVSESEIADAVAESSDKPKAALNYLLNKGFVLTRFADSFAIATGGAGFYRNQLEMYIKQGMPEDLAQKQAFEDFYSVAEKNQQSSNPSKISQQQASGAGRVILAFANTPMQYARIIKRSTQDLINGRGDWKKNVGTIAFYGVAQNLIFNAMQNALFADAFGEDDEEEDKSNKTGRIANGMADSLLAGLGIQGKGALALKNSLITLAKENDKDSPKFVKAVYDLFDFSPPLDSKFRKLRTAANTFTWDRKLMKEKGFSLDNPAYLAGAQVISGLTNVPLDRAVQKMNNIRAIMSEQSQNWQKVALALGWSTWDVGLGYYGGFDDPVPLTEEQQFELDVTTMRKDTNTKEQKQILLDLGLSKKEIKALRYEEDRVKKIIELQNKKKKDGK